MFGFFKKPKTASEQNEAALAKLKKLMDQELISRDFLKKMGLKTLLTPDPQITKELSHQDACECLRIMKFTNLLLLDFASRIAEQASKANDEIIATQGTAVFLRRATTTSHPFYTIKNIMEIFRNIRMEAEPKELDPKELEDPYSPLSVFLKMYETSLNIVTSGISCNITLVGMVIR